MKHSAKISSEELYALNKHWRWILGWGIGLIILGILAVSFATFTTLFSVVLLGGFILTGGLFVIIDSIHFWRGRGGFIPRLLMGILYSSIGLMLIFGPFSSSVALTLLIAALFILLGISRLASVISTRYPRWQWGFISGLISLLLGIFIMAEWPASGLFIIGMFIGIDLILFGWAHIMLALFLHNANR